MMRYLKEKKKKYIPFLPYNIQTPHKKYNIPRWMDYRPGGLLSLKTRLYHIQPFTPLSFINQAESNSRLQKLPHLELVSETEHWFIDFIHLCANLEYTEVQIPTSKFFVDFIFIAKNNVGKRLDHMLLGTQVFVRVNVRTAGDYLPWILQKK